jgi:nondiscriminating glutamyl-tRNA synthetase
LSDAVRVRIAPSPTGTLHVGTARTALYNYLYAKRKKGTFILRLEDTDEERSRDAYTEDILDGLHWLGLHWEEGPDVGGPFAPYKQTEKLDHYLAIANELEKQGKAYWAWETPEELNVLREQQKAANDAPRYNNSGRDVTPEQIEKYKAEGRKPSLRFKIDDNEPVSWVDAIRGEITINASELGGDMVIVKSNSVAIYNFAVVVDDIDMEITQVIRGEDHISNTAKQILIYKALGKKMPEFAHVPLMQDIERHKLSKRKHGEAVHVDSYRRKGYMPEAIVNYLAQMSWTPADGREIFTLEEAGEMFDMNKVSKSAAVFDLQRLNWFNGHYIRSLPLPLVTERARAFLDADQIKPFSDQQLEEIVASVREGLTTLAEIKEPTNFYFAKVLEIPQDVRETVLHVASARQVLEKTLQHLAQMPWSDSKGCKDAINAIGKELSLKGQALYFPLRAALSAKTKGPDLGTMFSVLGEKQVKARIESAMGLC